MKLYLGIDPGVSGGIAALAASGDVVLVTKMPESKADVWRVLSGLASGGQCSAVLEFVRSSPQMGVRGVFTFGESYGSLGMALVAAGVEYEEVLPRKWQGALGCLTGGNKNVTKARAQMEFPTVRVTHAVADALLLAEFCRQTKGGASARRVEYNSEAR